MLGAGDSVSARKTATAKLLSVMHSNSPVCPTMMFKKTVTLYRGPRFADHSSHIIPYLCSMQPDWFLAVAPLLTPNYASLVALPSETKLVAFTGPVYTD